MQRLSKHFPIYPSQNSLKIKLCWFITEMTITKTPKEKKPKVAKVPKEKKAKVPKVPKVPMEKKPKAAKPAKKTKSVQDDITKATSFQFYFKKSFGSGSKDLNIAMKKIDNDKKLTSAEKEAKKKAKQIEVIYQYKDRVNDLLNNKEEYKANYQKIMAVTANLRKK